MNVLKIGDYVCRKYDIDREIYEVSGFDDDIGLISIINDFEELYVPRDNIEKILFS